MFLNNDIQFGTSGAFCESLNNENNRDGSFVKPKCSTNQPRKLMTWPVCPMGVRQATRFDW